MKRLCVWIPFLLSVMIIFAFLLSCSLPLAGMESNGSNNNQLGGGSWEIPGLDGYVSRYYRKPSVPQSLSGLYVKNTYNYSGYGRALTGDVDGDGFLEVITSDRYGNVLIIGKDGVEAQWTASVPEFRILADINGDGRDEIGMNASKGTGKIIFYTDSGEAVFEFNYGVGYDGRIEPAYYENGKLYVVGEAGYSGTPRGVMRIDVSSKQIDWFFKQGPTPSESFLNVFSSDIISISNFTPHNGFNENGTDDGNLYYIILDSNTGGEIVKRLVDDGYRDGNLRVRRLFNGKIIAFENKDPVYYTGTTKIHIIRSTTGDELYEYRWPDSNEFIDGVFDESTIYVSGHRYGLVEKFSYSLEKLASRRFDGGVALTAIGDFNGDGANEILAIVNKRSLVILDKDLSTIAVKDYDSDIVWAIPCDIENDGKTDFIVVTRNSIQILGAQMESNGSNNNIVSKYYSDSKIVLKVETGADFDFEGILSDANLSAVEIDEGAYWEYTMSFATDVWYDHRGFPELKVRVLVTKNGDMYAGAINASPEDQLKLLTFGGISNYLKFDGHLLEQSVYGTPKNGWLEMNIKQNLLSSVIHWGVGSNKGYKYLYNQGYTRNGPTNTYEFYKRKFVLYNLYPDKITLIFSGIYHQQFDYSWYNKLYRPIHEAMNRKWSPVANDPDQDTSLSRSFDLSYSGVHFMSSVMIYASNDNEMWSQIKIYGMKDAEDYTSQGGDGYSFWYIEYDRDQGTYLVKKINAGHSAVNITNQYPTRVEITGYTTWSFFAPFFRMAIVGGDVNWSNVQETPSPGDDGNPSPMMCVIQPGENVIEPEK